MWMLPRSVPMYSHLLWKGRWQKVILRGDDRTEGECEKRVKRRKAKQRKISRMKITHPIKEQRENDAGAPRGLLSRASLRSKAPRCEWQRKGEVVTHSISSFSPDSLQSTLILPHSSAERSSHRRNQPPIRLWLQSEQEVPPPSLLHHSRLFISSSAPSLHLLLSSIGRFSPRLVRRSSNARPSRRFAVA